MHRSTASQEKIARPAGATYQAKRRKSPCHQIYRTICGPARPPRARVCKAWISCVSAQASAMTSRSFWSSPRSCGTATSTSVASCGRTDDELDKMNGRRDQLEGKIQERYGIAKDQAKKDVDTWFDSLKWWVGERSKGKL